MFSEQKSDISSQMSTYPIFQVIAKKNKPNCGFGTNLNARVCVPLMGGVSENINASGCPVRLVNAEELSST